MKLHYVFQKFFKLVLVQGFDNHFTNKCLF